MNEQTFRSGYLPPKWVLTQAVDSIQWKALTFIRGNQSVIVEVPDLTLFQSDSLCQYLKLKGPLTMINQEFF